MKNEISVSTEFNVPNELSCLLGYEIPEGVNASVNVTLLCAQNAIWEIIPSPIPCTRKLRKIDFQNEQKAVGFITCTFYRPW